MKLLAIVLSSLALVACGGGGGGGGTRTNSVVVSGVASKGPLNNSTVCAYSITNGAQGPQIGKCVDTSADGSGSYSIDLAGYTGPAILQVSGGTYVDEATGNTVTLSTPLRSILANLTGPSSAAITGMTELAFQLATGTAGGLTTVNIDSAVARVQNNFGVLDIIGTMPVDALHVPSSATVGQKSYSLGLAAISQYLAQMPAGSKLIDGLTELKTCLADSTNGCSARSTNVGSLMSNAVQAFVAKHNALSGINLPVASFGSVTTAPGNKSITYKLLAAVSASVCPNGGITVLSGIDTNGNGVLDSAEETNTQFVCNGANGAAGPTGGTGSSGVNGLAALVSIQTEPAGANCSSGGNRVNAGLDANGNNVLDTSEISSTSFICTGATGADGLNTLVKLVAEPAGANCTSGGNKIQAGLDRNVNGLLDSTEITSSQYVCNGTIPTDLDRSPPVITTTAPVVASSDKVEFMTAISDDVELAYVNTARDPSGTFRFMSEGVKNYEANDSASIGLGQTYSRLLMAVDTSGNVTKKPLTITTPETGIRLGNYSSVGSYSLPAGFNCLTGGIAELGVTDGTPVTGAQVGSYSNWSVLNGYVPNLILQTSTMGLRFGFPIGTSPGTLVPLSATVIAPASSGSDSGGSSGAPGTPGSTYYSYSVNYTVSVAVSPTLPSALDIALTMRCNENNAGYVSGTTAIFPVSWVGMTDTSSSTNYVPVARAGSNQTLMAGDTANLFGYGSSDANGDPLTYSWTLSSKPAGSGASLSATTLNTPFVPDLPGIYVIRLIVNDGKVNSSPSTMTITATPRHDYSNVTDYAKVSNTLISAVNFMNSMLLATPSYLDDLFNSNLAQFEVPIQNYFGSDVAGDMAKAQMTVTTIKHDYPVQASADRKPYRLQYDEFDSQGANIYTLRIGSIYGCSNANDVKNPTAECVQYSYQQIVNNVMKMSGSASVNLVKTTTNGLVYLSPLLQ